MKDTFYITTPIYYVNDVPHIGSVYTNVACDVMARFARLDGYDVKFLTGTDEHGQKVEKSAKDAGLSPQAFVDKIAENFKKMVSFCNISSDDFIRTSEERHVKGVSHLWEELVKKGYIYLGSYKGWYSIRDEAFYAESEIKDGKAPTGAPVEWVEEPSYFFKLSAFQEKLLKYYEDHPDFIGPLSRRNEVIQFVKSGLTDLSVSRTSFSWGIQVPHDPKHVIYVWLDALTNYLTALGYPEETEDFKKFWPALHVVGKDILRFHTVYWPAFLMAADLPLPKRIYAHGFWTNEGQKMSKSLKNTIDPIALIETYGLDPVRYFLIREIPFGQDGNFSKAHLIARMNEDLANDLGNLSQRVLSFIQKNAQARIPSKGLLNQEDQVLMKMGSDLLSKIRPLVLKDQELHRYIEEIWKVIAASNRYVDYQAPWTLKKTDPKRMETVLYVLCTLLQKIGILLQPLLPEASAKILDQLALPLEKRKFEDIETPLKEGTCLPPPQVIFPKFKEESVLL
ncbi:MAG: methionine--tRNA ligase [Proteobacteria bacterium]|nr:methionine--tRNA ligase [Pseudomonadota bacterium]